MQKLTGQDASFLYFETARTPMHIGGIQIYEQSTLPGGVQGFKNILAQIESRLHLARTFRQRVVRVPFSLDHPYWIEDKDFGSRSSSPTYVARRDTASATRSTSSMTGAGSTGSTTSSR